MSGGASDDRPAVPARGLVSFARALRAGGVRLGSAALLDACAALAAVGPDRRMDVRAALRTTLVRDPGDLVLFELLFDSFYAHGAGDATGLPAGGQVLAQAPSNVAPPAAKRRLSDSLSSRRTNRAIEAVQLVETNAGGMPSRVERFRLKDFEQMSAAEIAAAQALIRVLGRAQAQRRSRRSHSGESRGHNARSLDLRRMLRRRDLDTPRYRTETLQPRDCVLLVDISGSMSLYSRLFLHLAHALARCPGRVETFVFATRLSYITRALRIAEPDRAIAAASRAAPDWDGGTRLGACLAEFNRAWSRRVLGAGARVILLSDGLERDGIELLEPEVARLARAAYQLVWINPLLRSEAYEPLAAGAQVLARHADQLRSAHNIASLAELAQLLN
jgi:uncharacterized protein with von Willebrand factor type A (vWA) domain